MEDFNLKCKSFLEWFSIFVYMHCYFSGAYYLLNILSSPDFPRKERQTDTEMKRWAV